MATSILPQRKTFTPSPDDVQCALQMLNGEREEMTALVIVLLNRLEDKEKEQGFPSTDLVLMRMLDERVNSTKALQRVERVLTGVPA